ncbi:MAG: aminopeptidase P N-terminal domain-containing protein [Bacteroidales bacterium]|nr:aminopeptidase P N-terminal domain-containing protein [Bacteroidales bacterium]
MKTVTISPALFTRNRQRLVHALKPNSLAIFHANDELIRSADQYYPYRQDPDLFYLTGINQERTVLLIAPDHPDASLREVLLIRKPDLKLETWEGHKLTPEEAGAISGIKTIRYTDDYRALLATMMMPAEQVYLNLPEQPKFIPELPNRNLRFGLELKQQFPAHTYIRLSPVMRNLRMVKSDEEIALIREACNITNESFLRVLDTLTPGMMEYEVEAEITQVFLRKGARGHAYAPIIASGINACSLHYNTNESVCANGDLLLMDFGAEYGNYAADCSRTIPVNGRFTDRQRALYLSVLDVFRFACSLMKPGNTIQRIHNEVCKRFSTEHVKLGLYTREDLAGESADNPLYLQYYMHGTSHHLGIDVHDTGNKETELKPGMVITCEPGIYIREEKTGIRLENDILITSGGNEDLMKHIPVDPDEIEERMNRQR